MWNLFCAFRSSSHLSFYFFYCWCMPRIFSYCNSPKKIEIVSKHLDWVESLSFSIFLINENFFLPNISFHRKLLEKLYALQANRSVYCCKFIYDFATSRVYYLLLLPIWFCFSSPILIWNKTWIKSIWINLQKRESVTEHENNS